MTEDHDDQAGHDGPEDQEHHSPGDVEGRTTAPQSEYTTRDVAVGAAVAAVGLLVTVGLPLLLA